MPRNVERSEAPRRRRASWWRAPVIAAALVVPLVCGTWLWWALGPAGLPGGYAPGAALRYLERRLEGHPKLEWIAQPVLGLAWAVVRREPPPTLPTLGKGQRDTPLARIVHDARGVPQAAKPSRSETVARAPDRRVASIADLERALYDARAGEVIEIDAGTYDIRSTLTPRNGGTWAAPITLRAARPGSVTLRVATLQALVIGRPFWIVENLDWQGVCRDPHDCEHAIHVVGPARGTVIRNNRMTDFNAHVKVNGEGDEWPDDGLLQHNTLTNSLARRTTRPVTPFDLVGASGWQVLDNRIESFVRADSRHATYGLYMKGGGRGGRILRNLVICSPRDPWSEGQRVGISLGDGGSGQAYCRGGRCDHEHADAVVANNVVAHCNDAGIDISNSTRALVVHNTLVNTAGVLVRSPPSDARVEANLIEGPIHARPGTFAVPSDNTQVRRLDALMSDPMALDLRWTATPPELPLRAAVPDDFCGERRPPLTWPGATQRPSCE